jgi:uncharacterized protein HemX
MKAIIVAIIACGAAGAAGFYAWQQKQELDRTASELATTRATLTRANDELRKARETLARVVQELQEQQAAAEKMRSERDSAVTFLIQEKAYGERLRAELTLAQKQLAFVRTRQSLAPIAPPTVVQPRPMVIRALPAPRPQSAASPAIGVQRPAE